MSAPLSQLTVKPIRIPDYVTQTANFGAWIVDNKTALVGYFNDLQPYFDEPMDFNEFCVGQFQRAQLRDLIDTVY